LTKIARNRKCRDGAVSIVERDECRIAIYLKPGDEAVEVKGREYFKS